MIFFKKESRYKLTDRDLRWDKFIDEVCMKEINELSDIQKRRDKKENVVITTFDMRITATNREPVIDVPVLHTIEHLGATFLRNSDEKDNFGPMGCRIACYIECLVN